MSGRTVAVFTAELDVTADFVIVELHKRGVPVFRCDPADFPANLSVGARFGESWAGHLRTPHRSLDLSDIGCAWWRRPEPITIPEDVPEANWMRQEATAGVRGLLATLPWLNSPDEIRVAEHKPRQLATATRAGLSVPPTLITNDPDEARAFDKEHGPLIYKPMAGGLLSDGQIIYATPIDGDTIDDSVRATAHMFQQQITKAYELRITVVDGFIFAARINTYTVEGRRDWRADYRNLDYSAVTIPATVKAKIRWFMRMMGLRFACIDMIVTPREEHVFLEANPNGQWAWIEDETGLPIASAIADALERGNR